MHTLLFIIVLSLMWCGSSQKTRNSRHIAFDVAVHNFSFATKNVKKKSLMNKKKHNSYNINHEASYLMCLILDRRRFCLEFCQKVPGGAVRENKRLVILKSNCKYEYCKQQNVLPEVSGKSYFDSTPSTPPHPQFATGLIVRVLI